MNKAVFLDRDGVVIEQVHYLGTPDGVKLETNAAKAIKLLHDNGFLAIVITNQSGVARKMFTIQDVEDIHARIDEYLLAEGSDKVDGYFSCYHHPDFTGDCDCRKPKDGLYKQAAKAFDIDIAASYMIGDKFSDLEGGVNAGCFDNYLVLTGYGPKYEEKAKAANFKVAANIYEAVKDIVSKK